MGSCSGSGRPLWMRYLHGGRPPGTGDRSGIVLPGPGERRMIGVATPIAAIEGRAVITIERRTGSEPLGPVRIDDELPPDRHRVHIPVELAPVRQAHADAVGTPGRAGPIDDLQRQSRSVVDRTAVATVRRLALSFGNASIR